MKTYENDGHSVIKCRSLTTALGNCSKLEASEKMAGSVCVTAWMCIPAGFDLTFGVQDFDLKRLWIKICHPER